jgi:enoyl-CoA hydratase/carnithine racemase
MEHYTTIRLEKDKGIAKLTLNRPNKLNALNREMYLDIRKAIDNLEDDPDLRVVIFRGAGKAFCAGGDISELSAATESINATQQRLRMSHAIAARIKGIRQPVIFVINGDAIGGGCTLALNGDIRIASEKARFGISFIKLGLSVEMGGIYNLPRLVGISKACELAFLGRIINATEAESIGLVNLVVPAEQLDSVANDWAMKLAQFSPFSLSLMKTALYKGLNMDFASELEDEINIETLCMNSNDGRAALRAFIEKKKPSF